MAHPSDDLAKLQARGTVRDIGIIVEHYGSPEHWGDAVRALDALLSRARPRDLVWLEANARWLLGSYRYYETPWTRLAPSDVERLPAAAQRLAAFHASGHVREAAVRALTSRDDAVALACLLLRANDWVVQVADVARDALEQRLRPADAAAWIALLPLERHVRILKRRALAHLFDGARQLLVQADARPVFLESIVSGATEIRRSLAELALSLPPRERESVLTVAVRDRDAVVATIAVPSLLEHASDTELRATSGELLAHPIGRVRAQVLTSLAARTPEDALAPLRKALFDNAGSVREVAQFELRRRGAVEPLPLYVAALPEATGPRRLASIAGVAECGRAEHAALAIPFLRAPSPRVRLEALRALARLDGDSHASAFVDGLEDASPRVVRVCRAALRRRAHLVDRGRLDALMAAGGRRAREAMTLLPQVDYWGALPASLRALAVPEVQFPVRDSLSIKQGNLYIFRPESNPFFFEFRYVRFHHSWKNFLHAFLRKIQYNYVFVYRLQIVLNISLVSRTNTSDDSVLFRA